MKYLFITLAMSLISLVSYAEDRFIGVTGHGIVEIAPDKAELKFYVVKRTKDIQAAKKEMDEVVSKLISSMAEYAQISTVKSTQFRAREDVNHQTGEIRGFRASRNITIELTDVSKVNEVINKSLAAGTNKVDDIKFSVQDEAHAIKLARTKAIKDAQLKADELAAGFESKVGALISIQDPSFPDKSRPNIRYLADIAMEADYGAEIFVPKTVTYQDHVFAKYKLK
jgi:uncharacterized protein YggE